MANRLNTTPQRVISFSDTFGGPLDPLEREDADVHLCSQFRSRPGVPYQKEFDIYGQEQVTDHLLRLVVELHEQMDRAAYFSPEKKKSLRGLGTGVFVNAAPRTNHSNGQPFYLAELKHNITVVSTPLEALSCIREHIEHLFVLPNQDNGLYRNREQFRSSYTPVLFDREVADALSLQEVGREEIPAYRKQTHLAYVDRFGNCVTWSPDPQRVIANANRIAQENENKVRINIGEASHAVGLATSLGESEPGELQAYLNGGVDIVRKWHPQDTATDKLQKSAYRQFGNPAIGSPVHIVS